MNEPVQHLQSARWRFAALLAVVAFLAVGGWSLLPARAEAAETVSPAPTSIDPPAPPGSTFPALAAEDPTTFTREHEILMTWLEPGPAGRRLLFSRLSGQAWSRPVTVAEPVSPAGPGDSPSLTVIETQAVRRTLIAHFGDVVATSGDGGRTWARLPAPSLPFASFAGGDEAAYAFWLGTSAAGPAKLMGTRVLAGETLLDARAVGGSATAAAMTADGPVVVYRGLSAEGGAQEKAEGAQDIAIVRREEAQWTPPRPVHAEGWRPERISKSGPQVAARRRQVAVAWYTEAPDLPRLLVAFSSDAGRTFGAPVEVDAREVDHSPWGPVAVALDGNGQALVLWLAVTGSADATLNLARVAPDGKRGRELVLAKGPLGSAKGLPQIVVAGERVAASWAEGDPTRVRAASVPLSSIPAALESRRAIRPPAAKAASAAKPRPPTGHGRVGELAPDAELVNLAGDQVSLKSLRGHIVLLNLWATWCVPCLAEMPELGALAERYRGQGLAVVGVNVDGAETAARVRPFVAKLKESIAVWLDPDMDFNRALRVQALPANFVLDREGRIALRLDRPIAPNDPELEKVLSTLLSTTP